MLKNNNGLQLPSREILIEVKKTLKQILNKQKPGYDKQRVATTTLVIIKLGVEENVDAIIAKHQGMNQKMQDDEKMVFLGAIRHS